MLHAPREPRSVRADHSSSTAYFWFFRKSISTLRARDSSPKSVTTAHEQRTTLVASPFSSILQRPHHWPSCLPVSTMTRWTLPSSHSARTSLVYSWLSQSEARQQSFTTWASGPAAACWSRALAHLHRPRDSGGGGRSVKRGNHECRKEQAKKGLFPLKCTQRIKDDRAWGGGRGSRPTPRHNDPQKAAIRCARALTRAAHGEGRRG